MNNFRTERAEALRRYLTYTGPQTPDQLSKRYLVRNRTVRQMVADLREYLSDTPQTVVFLNGAYWLTDNQDAISEWASQRARALETGTQTIVNALEGHNKINATRAVANLTEV